MNSYNQMKVYNQQKRFDDEKLKYKGSHATWKLCTDMDYTYILVKHHVVLYRVHTDPAN